MSFSGPPAKQLKQTTLCFSSSKSSNSTSANATVMSAPEPPAMAIIPISSVVDPHTSSHQR